MVACCWGCDSSPPQCAPVPEAQGTGGPTSQCTTSARLRAMAFGQRPGPPASFGQPEGLALLNDAGHTDFRDARGPMGPPASSPATKQQLSSSSSRAMNSKRLPVPLSQRRGSQRKNSYCASYLPSSWLPSSGAAVGASPSPWATARAGPSRRRTAVSEPTSRSLVFGDDPGAGPRGGASARPWATPRTAAPNGRAVGESESARCYGLSGHRMLLHVVAWIMPCNKTPIFVPVQRERGEHFLPARAGR